SPVRINCWSTKDLASGLTTMATIKTPISTENPFFRTNCQNLLLPIIPLLPLDKPPLLIFDQLIQCVDDLRIGIIPAAFQPAYHFPVLVENNGGWDSTCQEVGWDITCWRINR